MNEKIESEFRKGMFRIEDGGDGIFYVLDYEPSLREQKKIYKAALLYFNDVQWCPDPQSHGEDAVAVLNCFYPVENESC